MSNNTGSQYAYPDFLVETDWVAENLTNPNVRIVESNEDPLLYPSGHIPGAFEVDWTTDLNDPIIRDYLNQDAFAKLMSRLGATKDTKIVFYGDKSNWWACYAFWVFQLFGHTNCAIMNGGRLKWINEGREISKDKPQAEPTIYQAPARDDKTLRAFKQDVLNHIQQSGKLVDVRSPQEFSGERTHMPDYPNEGAVRGGHIPTAKNVPWARAVNPETGAFLPVDQLKTIYEEEIGLEKSDDIIAYCRIGERSSLTWFTLKYLLGFPNVKNYDGSWLEWGNSVGVPIEK